MNAATATPPGTAQPPDRRRWTALYVLCIGMLMIVLDATVVNVALPSIQDDLGFTQSSLAWVVNAYLIAFGGLLLLSGRFGDLIGRRRVFLSGLALFTVASLACGIAPTQELLVGARFVQGLGGAMTSAVILGMIVTMFPEPREQMKAIGVYGFVAASGGSIGLLAGGVITDLINWHWIFIVNIPIGIATAVMARRVIDADEGIGVREGADIPGAVLVTGMLMLGVYTIVKPAAENGWSDPLTLGLAAATLGLLAAFIVREATARTPLVPLRIFRSRNVSGANLVQMLVVAGMFGMFFMGALYLERVLAYSPLQIGLAFLPSSLLMAVMSLRYSAKIIARVGPHAALLPSLLLMAAGLLLFGRAPADGTFLIDILPATLIISLGAGASFPALMALAMSGATQRDAGLASGLVNTTMQVGGAFGLAVLATLSATRSADRLAAGDPSAAALTSGYHLAFLVAAGFVLLAFGVALTVLAPRRQAKPSTAREPALSELA